MSLDRTLRPRVENPAKLLNRFDESESEEERFNTPRNKIRSKFIPQSSSQSRRTSAPVVTATCWISDFPEHLSRLVAGVKRYLPGVFSNERNAFRVFSLSATGTCAVLSSDQGITMVSTTGRVEMVSDAIAKETSMNVSHESEFQIPDCELKSRLFAHLNTKPRLFQGERLEYQCEISNSSVTKNHLFAEPWNLVSNDVRFPAGCDVIQHSVTPGAIFLVDKHGQVEIAFETNQQDIVLLSDDWRLESPTYTWNSYIDDIANLDHHIMSKAFLVPGSALNTQPAQLKDVVKYYATPVRPTKLYSPELMTEAQDSGYGQVHILKIDDSFLPVGVGFWVGTRCGKLALVMEMDDAHRITKIKWLARGFPGNILHGPTSQLPDKYQVIVIDQVIDVGEPISCPGWYDKDDVRAFQRISNICAQGYLLPISLATLHDKDGKGNLFVVGIGKYLAGKSKRSSDSLTPKLHIWGVEAPSPERILEMLQFMGTHLLTSAQKHHVFENIQFQICLFFESLAVDDSQTGGPSGSKANSFEILGCSSSALMSYLAHAKRVAYSENPAIILAYQIRVDTTSGLNMTFETPEILKYMVGDNARRMMCFQPIVEGSAMGWKLKTSDGSVIRVTGPVAMKVLFFPYEGAVISLSGWDLINQISGISMAGTGSISECKRLRELNASPASVLKGKCKRAPRCSYCWPSVCRC